MERHSVRGRTAVSPQNQHIDAYGVIMAPIRKERANHGEIITLVETSIPGGSCAFDVMEHNLR